MAKTKKVKKNNEAKGIWKIIGYLSIAVIVISLITLGMKLTGYASTDTGEINLTVETSTNINFSDALINFGSGQVNLGQVNATLESNGTCTNGNWTWAASDNLSLENIGNVNVSIDLKAGKTAAVFLGGSSPLYQYKILNKETTSCTNWSGVLMDTWYAVNTTSAGTEGTRICSPLKFNSSANSIYIDVRLMIPSDSKTGVLTDALTATATAM
ncbi:MAG: hypothetical protein Q8N99_08695 [Nanoarchaeota archaeon]|nr:hypothetical protein [Nanoarchaeota archaeon]